MSCIEITGITAPNKNLSNNDDQDAIINIMQHETGIKKGMIQKNINKMHPIGKPKQGKKQRIIKFKTDSFKEHFYH